MKSTMPVFLAMLFATAGLAVPPVQSAEPDKKVSCGENALFLYGIQGHLEKLKQLDINKPTERLVAADNLVRLIRDGDGFFDENEMQVLLLMLERLLPKGVVDGELRQKQIERLPSHLRKLHARYTDPQHLLAAGGNGAPPKPPTTTEFGEPEPSSAPGLGGRLKAVELPSHKTVEKDFRLLVATLLRRIEALNNKLDANDDVDLGIHLKPSAWVLVYSKHRRAQLNEEPCKLMAWGGVEREYEAALEFTGSPRLFVESGPALGLDAYHDLPKNAKYRIATLTVEALTELGVEVFSPDLSDLNQPDEILRNQIERSGFDWIASGLESLSLEPLDLKDYVIVNKDGLRFCVVSLLPDEVPSFLSQRFRKKGGLCSISVVNAILEEQRNHFDFAIVASHLGQDDEIAMMEYLAHPSIVIGGDARIGSNRGVRSESHRSILFPGNKHGRTVDAVKIAATLVPAPGYHSSIELSETERCITSARKKITALIDQEARLFHRRDFRLLTVEAGYISGSADCESICIPLRPKDFASPENPMTKYAQRLSQILTEEGHKQEPFGM